MATIARTQDYTSVKHNEDNKVHIDQMNIGKQTDEDIDKKAHEVNESENSQFRDGNFDSREKGKNEYAGDGGSRRRKNETVEKVVVKGKGGFDIRI